MSAQISSYYYSKTKRIFDVLLSLFLIFILAPLFLIVILIILFTTGRPILFIQKRTGLNKKAFFIYKFRTMTKNAQQIRSKYSKLNQAPLPMFKIYNDPRFVGVGQFLSLTGLDELPQLLNILRGEMSFVGPRPLPTAEAKQLNYNWDFRYQVKPGIFSFWTLNDKRHEGLTNWINLEKETVKNGGLRFEVELIINVLKKQMDSLKKYFKN